MKNHCTYYKNVTLLCGAVLLALYATAQVNTERFGQNRVQYKGFTFQYYESDNFTTYFYQGGQDVGKYVIKTAEDVSDEISVLLDFKYRKKIDIIVYNTIHELNQTNIGIYEQEQNPGGTTKIPENKIFIYYNGDHRHLNKQIREGIARVYIDKMVLGSGFAEVIQNAVLLNLPDWYKQGLIRYIGEPWGSDMEDRLRDGILSGRYKQLNKLPPEEAVFVGHSIWHYLEESAGKTAIGNIVYLTRINRSVDNGFLFVLGTNLEQTLLNWYNYYYKRFTTEKSLTTLPAESSRINARLRKSQQYYQLRLSDNAQYIAYASNDMGRYRVWLQDTDNGQRKRLHAGGFRTNTQFTDESVPLIAWAPGGKKVSFLTEWRSQYFLYTYDVTTGKKEKSPVRKFQKVLSMNYADSKQLVLSAMQNGQTDIYLYNIASTTTRKITDDYYDDLYPAYMEVDSMRGIMFSSNRNDDTLRPGRYDAQTVPPTHDLFFYNLDAGGNVLYRITHTAFASETHPQKLNENEYCFLSEQNGIRNRYKGHFEKVFDHNEKKFRFINKEYNELDSVYLPENAVFDSVFDKSQAELKDVTLERVFKTGGVNAPVTNYTRNIREQSIAPAKGVALDLMRQNGKTVFYRYNLNSETVYTPLLESAQKPLLSKQTTEPDPTPAKAAAPATAAGSDSAKLRGNRPFDFQSEFDYGIRLFDWDSASAYKIANAQEGYVFRFSRVRPYFVRFMIDNVVTQVDNNLLMTRYQPFDPNVPQFNVVPMAFMLKFGITDLLENHKLYGGVRFPFAGISNNSEYFITYENLTKRLDKRFTFYRRSFTDNAFDRLPFSNITLPNGYSVEYSIKTNYAEVELKYPLDVLNSLRFGFAFRNDLIVYKARDEFSLNLPRLTNNWLFLRAEYVFDNCIEVMTNIRYGMRFKVFAEVHKEFPTENKVLFDRVDFPVVQFNNKILGVFGLDFRHYQKIYKQIIWANRIAAGASFGTSKLIYYLGGLDNWITGPQFDKFNRSTPINRNNNYAFQTLSTPLRGFLQNARNGDKYIVINSELRIPLFAAFSNRPLRSDFIRNFQVVGFFDIGTAWEGLSPFSDENPLFNESLPNNSNSVIVRVRRYKTPVIFGFGPGLRTSFLGFFMRYDAAWGFDTGALSRRPIHYFTFGLDF